MCDAIEKQVSESQWIGGQQPSLADREAFESLSGVPNPDTHPHTFAWWSLVAKFKTEIRQSWAAAAAAPAKGGKAEPKKDAKKAEPKKEAKKEEPAKKDDDDFDPFADEEEDEDAIEAALELKHKAAIAKANKKVKEVIAKSIVIWEVKPYSAEVDLDFLAKKILAISMDGLVWKTEY